MHKYTQFGLDLLLLLFLSNSSNVVFASFLSKNKKMKQKTDDDEIPT